MTTRRFAVTWLLAALFLVVAGCGGSSSSTPRYTLLYLAADHGDVQGPAEQTVRAGDDGAPVTAVADLGYRFTEWSDGNTDATRQDMAVEADIEVTAHFAEMPAPTDLDAEALGYDGQAHLDWSPVPQGASYHIYVASEPIHDITDIGTLADHNRHTADAPPTHVRGLQNGREYYFVVTHVDGDNESLPGNQASATPFFAPVGGLPGSGVPACTADGERDLPCPVAGFPGQDAEFGRMAAALDGTLLKSGDGPDAFDFSRICHNGDAAGQGDCPPEPALGPAADQWGCTRDNVTGLLWEAKINHSGALRHQGNTYTWHDPDTATNGGDAGVADGGDCSGSACDTAAFVAAVNQDGLCGQQNWRLPSLHELHAIQARTPQPASGSPLPGEHFPNVPRSSLWSAASSAATPSRAWFLSFLSSTTYDRDKDGARAVMLVSGQAADGPLDEAVFTLNDDTALHQRTGQQWRRCAAGQTFDNGDCLGTAEIFTWQAALAYADSVDGWRLPNIQELFSIIDKQRALPALDTSVFRSGLSNGAFWSSTPDLGSSNSAWVVDIRSGQTNRYSTTSDTQRYVVLVRED